MRKRNFYFIVLALCLTICACAAFAADYTRTAVVDDLRGTVNVTQNEINMPAFRGLALLRGDGLSAGAESWSRLELDEGRFAVVEENTEVQIAALADGLLDAKTTRVYMSGGKVWFDVARGLSEGESFEVNTPTCALSVRGTFFSVDVRDDETSLSVYRGEVALRAERLDGTPMLDSSGGEVEIVVSSGEKATVSSETGIVAMVMQGELAREDFVPLQQGEEEGPGGVYEVLRDQVREDEEFMRHIERQVGQQADQQIDPQLQQLLEQPIETLPIGQLDMDEPAMSRADMQQVVELLEGGPAFPETLIDTHDPVNENPIPDPVPEPPGPGPEPPGPAPNPVNASIIGNLNSGAGSDGRYSFNVNLGSGAITDGTMSGQYGGMVTYDLTGGTGSVSGSGFDVGGFHGSVNDAGYTTPADSVKANLNGTAGNGFDNLGDIGASGTFEIVYGYGDVMYGVGGTIADGRRIE